ncbi:MAG: PilZ domain-containing protein [Candidatus Omnitrophica bacterium]|nr:PilZ domain-containing protein [Candidatus Omnitrophota bacterium]
MINEEFGHRRLIKRKTCFLTSGYLLLNTTPHLAKFHDISLEGIGIVTERPLHVSGQVKLALNTRKKGLVLVEGKICWCRRTKHGWKSGIAFNKRLSYEPAMIC